MSKFKAGDPVTWYVEARGDGDYQELYYRPVDGFVVSLTENGCVVGANESGRVFWFDNSRLEFSYECDHKIRYAPGSYWAERGFPVHHGVKP